MNIRRIRYLTKDKMKFSVIRKIKRTKVVLYFPTFEVGLVAVQILEFVAVRKEIVIVAEMHLLAAAAADHNK